MSKNADRLYELLPMVYRERDAEEGFKLQALLRVIAEQVEVVEADITQLYENWFIETCQDWVVPYIGDLIGYQIVHEAGEPGEVNTAEGRLRNKILIARRDVANTILHRRRKGTLSLLEQLANDVAGWPAHAVEFFTLLGWTQNINDLQLQRGRTVDIHAGDALDHLNGPFDEIAHTVDVRRIVSQHTRGRYNIPSVGVFVWRLKVYSVTQTRARLLEQVSDEAFTFSILGNDSPLYTKKQEKSPTQRYSNELNFPTPIRRHRFEKHLADYYGEDKSLFIWAGTSAPPPPKQPAKRGRRSRSAKREQQATDVIWEPVDIKHIVPADLSKWQYQPTGDQVAVDPVLGRIAFAPDKAPANGLRVLYHYAFSADIGGGEYNRPLFNPPDEYQFFRVSKQKEDFNSLEDALERWQAWKQANLQADPAKRKPPRAVIEIADSGVYVENRLVANLDPHEILHIRAANRKRPVIRLLEERVDRTNALDIGGGSYITGEANSRLVLDGLLIFGRGVHIRGELAKVTIRHCTLVPGWDLEHDCEPKWASEPSLTLTDTDAAITIEHSILGAIRVEEKEVQEEPIRIQISDSILDTTNNDHLALGASPHGHKAFAKLNMRRCTVFGKIEVHEIDLAENSIFNSTVKVARSQKGCVRFCYVPEHSRTPPRYNCQPDLVKQAVANDDTLLDSEKPATQARESARVVPVFNSVHYGTPTYCQLAHACADEIKRGADDESEMGAFHDLFQPQRAANLRARLDEYTPAAIEAGIIYAN
jgi:hypothetical protein